MTSNKTRLDPSSRRDSDMQPMGQPLRERACDTETSSSSDELYRRSDARSPSRSSSPSSASPTSSDVSLRVESRSNLSFSSHLRSQVGYLHMSLEDAVRAYVLLRPPDDDSISPLCVSSPRTSFGSSASAPRASSSPSVSGSRSKAPRSPSPPLSPAAEKRLQEGAVTSLSLKLCSGALHILQLTRVLRRFLVDARSRRSESGIASKAGAASPVSRPDREGDESVFKAADSETLSTAQGANDSEADSDDEAGGASGPNAFARKAQRRRRAALLLGEVLQRTPSLPFSSSSAASLPSAACADLRDPAGQASGRHDEKEKGRKSPEANGDGTSSLDRREEHATLSHLVSFCLENINDWYVVEGACTALLALVTHHQAALKSANEPSQGNKAFAASGAAPHLSNGNYAPEESPEEDAEEDPLGGEAAEVPEANERGNSGRDGTDGVEGAGERGEQNLVEKMMRRVLLDVHAPSFAQNVRQLILRLILVLLRDFKTEVAALATRKKKEGGVDVVSAVCTQLEGERDPRCLLLLFEIVAVLGSTYSSLMKRTDLENVVDAAMTYFPISFNPPANAPIPITEEMLVSAFHKALTSSPLFSSFVLLYLMDALASAGDEGFQQTLEDVKRTATAVLPFFPPSAALATLEPLQGLMLQSCFDAPSVHTPQLVLLWVIFLKRAVQVDDTFDEDGGALQVGEGTAEKKGPEDDSETSSSASSAALASSPPAEVLEQVRPLLEELFGPLVDFQQPPGSPACTAACQFLLRSAVASAAVCRVSLDACILPLLKLTLACCPSAFSSQATRKGGGKTRRTSVSTEEAHSAPNGKGWGDSAASSGGSRSRSGGEEDESGRVGERNGIPTSEAAYRSEEKETEELLSAWDTALPRVVSTVQIVERFLTTCIAAGVLANEDACSPAEAGLLLLRLLSLFTRARCHLALRMRTDTFSPLFQAIAEVAALPQQLPELRDVAIRLFASLLGFSPSNPFPVSSPLSSSVVSSPLSSSVVSSSVASASSVLCDSGAGGVPALGGEREGKEGRKDERGKKEDEEQEAKQDEEKEENEEQEDGQEGEKEEEEDAVTFQNSYVNLLEMTLRLEGLSGLLTDSSSFLLGLLRALQHVLLARRELSSAASFSAHALAEQIAFWERQSATAVSIHLRRSEKDGTAGQGDARGSLVSFGSSVCTPENRDTEGGTPGEGAASVQVPAEAILELVEQSSSLPSSLLPRNFDKRNRRTSPQNPSIVTSLAVSLSRILLESGTLLLRGSLPSLESDVHFLSSGLCWGGSEARTTAKSPETSRSSLLSLLPPAVSLEMALAVAAVLLGRSNLTPLAFASMRISDSPPSSSFPPFSSRPSTACTLSTSSPSSPSPSERPCALAETGERREARTAVSSVLLESDEGLLGRALAETANHSTCSSERFALEELQRSIAALFVASAAQAAQSSSLRTEGREKPGEGEERESKERAKVVGTRVLKTTTECLIAWLRIAHVCANARANEEKADRARGGFQANDRSHASGESGVCTPERASRNAASSGCVSFGERPSGSGEESQSRVSTCDAFSPLIVALRHAVCVASSDSTVDSSSFLCHLRRLVDLLLHALPAAEATTLGVSLLSLAVGQGATDVHGEGETKTETDAEGEACGLLLAPAVLPFLARGSAPENENNSRRQPEQDAPSDLSIFLERLLDRCISWTEVGKSRGSVHLARGLSEAAVLQVVQAVLYFARDTGTLRRLLAALDEHKVLKRKACDEDGTQSKDCVQSETNSSPCSAPAAPCEQAVQATVWSRATVEALFLREETHAEDFASARLRTLLLPVFAPLAAVSEGRPVFHVFSDTERSSRRYEEQVAGEGRTCVSPPAPQLRDSGFSAASGTQVSPNHPRVSPREALPALWLALASSRAVARLLADPVTLTTELLIQEGDCFQGEEQMQRLADHRARGTDQRRGTDGGGQGKKERRTSREEDKEVLPGLLPLLPCSPPSFDGDNWRSGDARHTVGRHLRDSDERTFLHFRLSDRSSKRVARSVLVAASSGVCTLRGQLAARGPEALVSRFASSVSLFQALCPQVPGAKGARDAPSLSAFQIRLAALPGVASLARAATCLPVEEVLLHGIDDACSRQFSSGSTVPPLGACDPQPQRGLLATLVLWAVSLYFSDKTESSRPALHPLTRSLLRVAANARTKGASCPSGGQKRTVCETGGETDQRGRGEAETQSACKTEKKDRSNAVRFVSGHPSSLCCEAEASTASPSGVCTPGFRLFAGFLSAVEEAEDTLLASTLLLILSAQRRKRVLRELASQRAVLASSPLGASEETTTDSQIYQSSNGASQQRAPTELHVTPATRNLQEAPVSRSANGEEREGTLEKREQEEADRGGEKNARNGEIVEGRADVTGSSHALEEMELQFLDGFIHLILPFLLAVAQQGGREEVERKRRRKRERGLLYNPSSKGGFASPVLRLFALQAAINYADRPMGVVAKMQKEVLAGVSPALDDPVRVIRRAAAVCKNRWSVFE
ncbi:hypothetical protein TGGT1_222230 [Toxoplasma gondii GT1]|uniref:MMS19 nucleotide excision repair protein n=3 Tax=Toxoplasma gondii TaxID=5811 RepID=S7UK88_TOXGG|nr:hypothetical protein TGGT1_222230 [Toxoplasma gondii GT1]KAF4645640.1 hypothetical protein TGRH88_001260 [Toxoplasma gondii]